LRHRFDLDFKCRCNLDIQQPFFVLQVQYLLIFLIQAGTGNSDQLDSLLPFELFVQRFTLVSHRVYYWQGMTLTMSNLR